MNSAASFLINGIKGMVDPLLFGPCCTFWPPMQPGRQGENTRIVPAIKPNAQTRALIRYIARGLRALPFPTGGPGVLMMPRSME
jgi:hypothetical protein